MSSPSGASLVAICALLAVACQVSPPKPTPAPSPVVGRDLERFQLRDLDAPREPTPIDLFGTPDEAAPGTTRDMVAPTETPPVAPARGAKVVIEDVLRSVERHFPLVLAALDQIEIAEGELLTARGAFDLRFDTRAKAGLEGFYQNDRIRMSLEQPTTLWGATFLTGYRQGSGDFADYDGRAETNTNGEVLAGVRVPLLKGGRVDQRRVDLWQARLAREQADPLVVQKRLEATRKAASTYWKWVAAGQRRAVAGRLLALAEDRQEAVALAVEEGQLAEIALIENERLIVERESIVVRIDRELQRASIELSLYLRDGDGAPVVPPPAAVPESFPSPRDPELTLRDGDEQLALKRRPEVLALEIERNRLGLDLDLARNGMLPRLDVGVLASQDLGDPVSTPDDKGPFELSTFLTLEVPIQRRGARGDRRATEGKLAKLQRDTQFVKDRIVTEVQDAASALRQTWLRLEQVRENVRLAGQLEEAERLRLREGESDLFRVNLREQQTAAAASALIDVLAEHFRALADYRAVVAVPYDEVRAGLPVGGSVKP